MVLLRYLDIIKIKNPEITESILLDYGRKYNVKHFEIKLDDDTIKVKAQNAMLYGGQVALEQLQNVIKNSKTVTDHSNCSDNSYDDSSYIKCTITDLEKNETILTLPRVSRDVKDKISIYEIDYFARKIVERLHIKTIYGLEDIYYFSNDSFFSNGEMIIKKICEKCIDACKRDNVSEVVDKVKRLTYITLQDIYAEQEGWQNFQNGRLNMKTRELFKYTPEKFILNKLPILYDPKAACPKIIKFLTECIPNKKDRLTILEGLAACLTLELRLEKAFMNLGGGGNGKSIWLLIMEHFVGLRNCCHLPITDIINSTFKVAELHGKIMNTYAEISKKEIKGLEKFKLVVSGDMITVEKKNKGNYLEF